MTAHSARTAAAANDRHGENSPGGAWSVVAVGCVSLAFFLQNVLASDLTAGRFLSGAAWQRLVELLGGSMAADLPSGTVFAEVPFLPLLLATGVLSAIGCAAIRWMQRANGDRAAAAPAGRISTAAVVCAAWRWWLIPGMGELIRIAVLIAGPVALVGLLSALTPSLLAIALAGWTAEIATSGRVAAIAEPRGIGGRPARRTVLLLSAITIAYVLIFTAMNWQLYASLLIPHGDSAMYEEHLWNVLHGKGFRSYLDPGLFLGEHMQAIHLLLIPAYMLWPSHLLLEAAQSLALASTAVPVFWITRRATGSQRCGLLLAATCLLYPPLQFLDIAIDLKTFRPIAFGIPIVLFALDQFERGRFRTAIALCVLGLSAKEDYTLIFGPLGVWIAVMAWRSRFSGVNAGTIDASPGSIRAGFNWLHNRATLWWGIGLAAGAASWLLLTMRVLIPYFRDGNDAHYSRYFSKFGASSGEILINMLTSPGLLLGELITVPSMLYAAALLLPLALLPLLSLSRLLVAVPILALLCLNEIIQSDPQPHHHFHAPVIPILFWAAAHGLANLQRRDLPLLRRMLDAIANLAQGIRMPGLDRSSEQRAVFAATLACAMCLAVGFTTTLSPLSIRFWDAGSPFYWRTLYVPGERAEMFQHVAEIIPPDARVAATDYVHTRLTHCDRSYDYSSYPRRVADYEDRVPHDTQYIVIDTKHRYSSVHALQDVREIQRERDQWDVLPDNTNGCFIVLKRRETAETTSPEG